jgi:hypothetical protein
MKYYYRLKCGKEFRFHDKLTFNDKGYCLARGEVKLGEYAQGMDWVAAQDIEFQSTEISGSWKL